MYKGGNSRSYVILATNPKTDITLFKSNDSFEVNWTTFGKKKESTALIGYALVKVANCKKKKPKFENIYIKDDIRYTDIYWTTGKQPSTSVYNTLDDEQSIICIVYGIKRINGQIDIDINPLIGGKIEPNEDILDCVIRETNQETGIKISKSNLCRFSTRWTEDNKYYFTLKI